MIHFTQLRTRRLDVQLRELPIGEAIKLARIPAAKHQLETSEFLRVAVAEARTPTARHVADPRAWTIEERMRVVCHYLSTTSEEGGNFNVGDKAHLSDYLLHEKDYPKEDVIRLGEIDEAEWVMRPLLGAEAEAIEAIQFEAGEDLHFHWLRGAMAAQLRRGDETSPQAVTDFAEYIAWLQGRMKVLAALGESTFAQLMRAWLGGQDQLQHFYSIEFNGNGALAMPVREPVAELRPARFLARACLSSIALRLGGKSE